MLDTLKIKYKKFTENFTSMKSRNSAAAETNSNCNRIRHVSYLGVDVRVQGVSWAFWSSWKSFLWNFWSSSVSQKECPHSCGVLSMHHTFTTKETEGSQYKLTVSLQCWDFLHSSISVLKVAAGMGTIHIPLIKFRDRPTFYHKFKHWKTVCIRTVSCLTCYSLIPPTTLKVLENRRLSILLPSGR